MSVYIDTSGIKDLDLYFERFPQQATDAMRIALNNVAGGEAIKIAKRQILTEIAYPDGYLDGNDRLAVSQYATNDRLEARVKGRDRPTSLARFTPTGTPVAKKGRQPPNRGITVTIKPGQPQRFASGFLVGLNNGNTGFAIRLRAGETVRGVKRYQPIELWEGVFLLYGPSVDQAFESVATEIEPEVTSALEAEFQRQLTRLLGVG